MNCDYQKYKVNKYKNAIIKKRGSLKDNRPELAEEWDYNKNFPLLPEDVTCHSKLKVWWKCEYGHSWLSCIGNRFEGCGCPICMKEKRTSFPEQAIFYYLKKVYCNVDSGYIIDNEEIDIFLSEYLIGVEYDGYFYHKKKCEKELEKYNRLKSNNITLIRVRENNLKIIDNTYDYYILSEYLNKNYDDLDNTIKSLIELINRLTKTNNMVDVDVEKHMTMIQKEYFENKKSKSLKFKNSKLSVEFDVEKNNGLTPDMIYNSDNRKYWWKCSKGHNYMESPNNRNNGRGCPFCSNHKLLSGFNDLKTINVKLSEEFDVIKNGIDSSKVLAGGRKKYWWICPNGHSYQASMINRLKHNSSCPACSGSLVIKGENDLITVNPIWLVDWDYKKNTDNPSNYKCGSGHKVWWKCNECGYEWMSSINDRNRGKGCKKCGLNKISSKLSKMVIQYDLNGNFIREYRSITEAMNMTGVKHISNACRGERKHAGGYIWKYKIK